MNTPKHPGAASTDRQRVPSRRFARSTAFQVLYSLHFAPVEHEIDLRRVFHESPDVRDLREKLGGEPNAHLDEGPKTKGKKETQVLPSLPEEPAGFAWELVLGVWRAHKELNKILADLSQNWKFERIGRIELTLLQIALFEMLNRPDVPPKVAINEAVELAKQYGDENSKNFVNGMLDAVAKAMETGKIKPHWA